MASGGLANTTQREGYIGLAVSEAFSCPNCGAAVTFPTGRIADSCAFCETPLVRASEEEREPIDLVASFQLTREVAAGRLRGRLSASVQDSQLHHLPPT